MVCFGRPWNEQNQILCTFKCLGMESSMDKGVCDTIFFNHNSKEGVINCCRILIVAKIREHLEPLKST